MTTVNDVPAGLLLDAAAAHLIENNHVDKPDWASFVKTGVHREQVPEQSDWWAKRGAAILRKIALKGPIGINHLSLEFGGRRDIRSRPSHSRRSSRKVLRTLVQQLEQAGLVTKKNQVGTEVVLGRVLTPVGQSFLDNTAHEIKQSMVEEMPRMALY